jgi:predicted RNase H-like nuclease (RuvC/YqgF family)
MKLSIKELQNTIRDLKRDVRDVEDEITNANTNIGKLTGKLDLVEVKTKGELSNFRELSAQQFKSLTDALIDLKALMVQSENQAQTNGKLFGTILEDYMKIKK